ncbi:putative Protein kinase domain-containing protein [Seiridium cardinale]
MEGPSSAAGQATETQSLFEPNHGKIIGSVLSKSLPDLSDSRLRFVPRDTLINVISKEVVGGVLQSCLDLGRGQQLDLAALADNIAPPVNGCHCARALCTGGRIIFMALLAISRETLITSFFELPQPGLCDSDLPLLSQETVGSPRIVPERFQHMSTNELERFIHFTWQMRSPSVRGFDTETANIGDLDTIQEFESNVSLPWTYLGDEEDPIDGAVTRVQRIAIHPAHQHSARLGGDLALKTFLERRLANLAERSWKNEVQASHRTRQHIRIVSLLAAFKHRGRFHLLLPWAHGGNLGDLFKRFATCAGTANDDQQVATWYSEDWLLRECEGLADGLAAVHEINHDNQHPRATAQIHADIKPENILCFSSSNKETGPFTLKLADFGEALEVSASTKDVKAHLAAHTKTYRPPEHDTNDLLTLNYDVWCLGCVYLEFVTWAIDGLKSRNDFEETRFNERDDAKVYTGNGKFFSDTFFKKQAEHTGWQFYKDIKCGRRSSRQIHPKRPKTLARKRHSLCFKHKGGPVRTVVKDGVTSM